MYYNIGNSKEKLIGFLVLALLCSFSNSSVAADRVIEEVIVSAQKKPQSLQDVPASVSSFDGDFIKNIGAADIGEIVKYTPNVKFDGANASTVTLTIRGYGTPPLAVGLEPSVGLVIDDISYGRSSYIIDSVYDIANVEILRGPQGTLFGKNTIAGVMSVNSEDAGYDWAGYAAFAKTSGAEKRLELAQSFTLIDEVLAGRIAVRMRDRESGFYNTAKDRTGVVDDLAGRLKLRWDATESLSLQLSTAKSDYESREPVFQLSHASERSLAVFRERDPEIEDDASNATQSVDGRDYGKRIAENIDFKMEYELGDWNIFQESQLSLIAGWSETSTDYAFDGDFSPAKFIDFSAVVPDYYEQSQLELRFNGTTSGPFGWGRGMDVMLGVFANASETTTSSQQRVYFSGLFDFYRAGTPISNSSPQIFLPELLVGPLGLLNGAVRSDQSEGYFSIAENHSESAAVFANMEWFFNEKISAILGLRYGEDNRDGRVASGPLQQTTIIGRVLGYETFDENLTGADYNFSFRTALSWQPSDEHSLFVSIAEGFKTGGFAVGVYDTRNLDYEAETGLSYELGTKSKFLDNSLSLNATLYYSQFKNLQARDFDGSSFLVSNASDAVSYGLELDFLWLPSVKWLTVGGSAGFISAKYIDYPCGPGDPSASDGSGPEECQQLSSGANTIAYADFSGEPLPFAPTPTGSLFANISVPVSGSFVFLAGVDVLYQGEQTPGVGRRFLTPAMSKVNARLGLMSHGGFRLVLHGKNLTSEPEVLWSFDQTMLPGNYVSAVAATERLWQLEIRYDWGQS